MSVYFARVKGYVKIGYSANPAGRMGTITSGTSLKPDDVSYGDHVELMGWVPGDRRAERAAHRRFAHLGVVGEWFLDDDCYERYIADDEFGVLALEMSAFAVEVMNRHGASREKALAAAEIYHAERKPDLAILGLTEDWVADLNAESRERRAADRAYWRAQRGVA